jgi:hypothetical protein
MPVLTPNRPLEQADPQLLVEDRLAVGRHRFALQVVDDRGRVSQASEWVVEVQRLRAPDAPDRSPT